MDYKEKYEQALERAKGLLEGMDEGDYFASNEDIENIFPELKESEDERIKFLIKSCVYAADITPEGREEIFAWLEKQGEQKSVDKAEPKFKVGDWITNGRYIRLVVGVDSRHYQFKDGDAKYIDDIDKKYHLWTINDAKDGDVLYSIDSKQPFIYKERPQFSQARGYCCINKFDEFAIWNTNKCVICTDKYIPATKEQRDFLFQKMKEAGYEWDAEKKELKKIEPKKVNANKVIEWLKNTIKANAENYGVFKATHLTLPYNSLEDLINDFKKNFGL